jgi:hypothetical protein
MEEGFCFKSTMIDLENSCNQVSIQPSVLNRFEEMGGLDVFLAFEVGNGSGYL